MGERKAKRHQLTRRLVPMNFWYQLKESLLDEIFGYWQREAWRTEKKHREECERVCQEQYEIYKRSAAN